MDVAWAEAIGTWAGAAVTLAAVAVALTTSRRAQRVAEEAHAIAAEDARQRHEERKDDQAAHGRTVLSQVVLGSSA